MVATRRSRKESEPDELPTAEDAPLEHKADASQSDDDEAPEEVTFHKSKTVRGLFSVFSASGHV